MLMLAAATNYPLHLGVTEAGPGSAGLLKATAGIATQWQQKIEQRIAWLRQNLSAPPSTGFHVKPEEK